MSCVEGSCARGETPDGEDNRTWNYADNGYVFSFSRDRPRFNDTLDVIKFLCKDLWSLVFGKNIDNLKTNHRVRTFAFLYPISASSRSWVDTRTEAHEGGFG